MDWERDESYRRTIKMIPRVIMHVAASVDGRLDWGISPNSPYYDVIRSFHADVDLTGTGTMLAAPIPDDPQAAFGEAYEEWAKMPARPMLAIVDSRGQIRNWQILKKQPWWGAQVALCSETTPEEHIRYLRGLGVDYVIAGREKVDLRLALEELNTRYGTQVVRADCGGILNGVLLRAGLVSEVSVIVNPALVGGTSARTMFAAPDLTSEAGVIPLKLLQVERLNEQFVWLRYEVCR
jgi:2,5-diamino-6-(ribosylamino)-4(3H)-pyrimidinone 5'-phosphate reductase